MALPIIEPNQPAYTSVKGAARLLDCHIQTVHKLLNTGQLMHVRIGKAIRIPLSELTPEALAANGGDR